jgi:hypothetical protein
MPNLSVCLVLASVLVAGCAASRMPETGFEEPQVLERAVMSYYERHATEENRTCLSPFMYGLTQVDVVEQHGERRFTLGKSATGFEVLEMTGPQRTTGTA